MDIDQELLNALADAVANRADLEFDELHGAYADHPDAEIWRLFFRSGFGQGIVEAQFQPSLAAPAPSLDELLVKEADEGPRTAAESDAAADVGAVAER